MKIETQVDAVVHFIHKMDIEMLNDILDDKLTYQDMEKHRFLDMLEIAFDAIKRAGNEFLIPHKGMCNRSDCNYKFKGYSFRGDNTGAHIDLIIEQTDGIVEDIYECDEFRCKPKTASSTGLRVQLDVEDCPF